MCWELKCFVEDSNCFIIEWVENYVKFMDMLNVVKSVVERCKLFLIKEKLYCIY